jgi:glutamine synthetase
MICDIYRRMASRSRVPAIDAQAVIALAAERGFAMNAGPEAEFFLFQRKNGVPTRRRTTR